jgi:C-terminal processing protease CtpA/Prc
LNTSPVLSYAISMLALLSASVHFSDGSDPSQITGDQEDDEIVTIGIGHTEPNPSVFEDGLDPALGREIEYVIPGSTADRLGVQPGDVIIGINGIPVTDGLTIRRELTVSDNGDPVNLTVWRNGEEFDLSGTITPVESHRRSGIGEDDLAYERAYRDEQRQRISEKVKDFYADYNNVQELRNEVAELQRKMAADVARGQLVAPIEQKDQALHFSAAWILRWHSGGADNSL